MKIKLGTLRAVLWEAMSNTRSTVPSAPTDADAAVPGHLPEELPGNMEPVDEEAWMPGRWAPFDGEPVTKANAEKLGNPSGAEVEEADARVEGDSDDDGMSAHLRTDVGLGQPGEHDL